MTFTHLAATHLGRTDQLNRAFRGMADDLKRQQVIDPDCDQPADLPAALRLIEYLKQKLDEAQAINDDLRTQLNGDVPVVTQAVYWDSARVARESGVAVCTICRNAQGLGGIKLGGDWLFPVGTTYGKKRNRKAK